MRLLERYPKFRDAVFSTNTPVLVDVTDAVNWYFNESDQEYWDLAIDLHALTPPHQYTYAEFVMPNRLNSEGNVMPIPTAGLSFGCLLACFEIDEEKRMTAQTDWLLEHLVAMDNSHGDDAVFRKNIDRITHDEEWLIWRQSGISKAIAPAFILDAIIYVGGPSIPQPFSPMRMTMYLDNEGKAFPGTDGTYLLSSAYTGLSANDINVFTPFAFALSLMNCKNVELIDDQRRLSRQEYRRMKRDNKPLIDYKWLRIKQLQKRVQSDMERHSKNGRTRLHFVRAHWATYTSDAPLFGKYEGTFFKPSHVRGNLASGVVAKGYKVNKP